MRDVIRFLLYIAILLFFVFFVLRFILRLSLIIPGLFVFLSLIATYLFARAARRGSWHAIGIREPATAWFALLLSLITFVAATVMLVISFM